MREGMRDYKVGAGGAPGKEGQEPTETAYSSDAMRVDRTDVGDGQAVFTIRREGMSAILSRRELLRRVGLGAAGLVLAACQPKVVEVEKIVKETVEVEKEVEKVVKETVVVEKEVQAAQPTRGPIELMAWSLASMNPESVVWKPHMDTVHAIIDRKSVV